MSILQAYLAQDKTRYSTADFFNTIAAGVRALAQDIAVNYRDFGHKKLLIWHGQIFDGSTRRPKAGLFVVPQLCGSSVFLGKSGPQVCFGTGLTDSSVKYFVTSFAENDEVSREEQAKLWDSLVADGLPLPTVTDSGGKSLHGKIAIWAIKVDAATTRKWRECQAMLIVLVGGDPANCNPARKMRLGASRDAGRDQWIVCLGGPPVHLDDLHAILTRICTKRGVAIDAAYSIINSTHVNARTAGQTIKIGSSSVVSDMNVECASADHGTDTLAGWKRRLLAGEFVNDKVSHCWNPFRSTRNHTAFLALSKDGRLKIVDSSTLESVYEPLASVDNSVELEGVDWIAGNGEGKDANPENGVKAIKTASRYLATFDPYAARVTFVRSSCGTGKTYTVCRKVIPALSEADSILYIVAREKLTHSVTNEHGLENLGFTHYQKSKGREIGERRVICCVDSLPRITPQWEDGALGFGSFKSFDFVVIDESEQVCRHLGGETVRRNGLTGIHGAFEAIVKNANAVICMDNDLGALTLRTIRRWVTGDADSHLPTEVHIENSYEVDRNATLIEDVDRFRQELKSSWRAGMVFAVPCLTKRDAKNIHEELRAAGIPSTLIHADNAGDLQPIEFVDDPNAYVANMKTNGGGCIIYSPVINTGTSVTSPVDAVWLYGNAGEHATITSTYQGLWRFRHPDSYCLHLSDYAPRYSLNRDEIWEGMVKWSNAQRNTIMVDLGGMVAEVHGGLLELLVDVTLYSRLGRVQFRPRFLQYLERRRWKLTVDAESPANRAKQKRESKKAKDAVRLSALHAAEHAPDIDEEDYLRLRRLPRKNSIEMAQLNRYKCTKLIGKEPTREDLDRYLHHNLASQVSLLADVRMLLSSSADLSFMDGNQWERSNAGAKWRKIRAKLLISFLNRAAEGSLGVTNFCATTLKEKTEKVCDTNLDSTAIWPWILTVRELFKRCFGIDPVKYQRRRGMLVAVMVKKMGLEASQKQIRVEGERRRVYRLSADSLDRMLDYTEVRVRDTRNRVAILRANRELMATIAEDSFEVDDFDGERLSEAMESIAARDEVDEAAIGRILDKLNEEEGGERHEEQKQQ